MSLKLAERVAGQFIDKDDLAWNFEGCQGAPAGVLESRRFERGAVERFDIGDRDFSTRGLGLADDGGLGDAGLLEQ